MSVDLQPIIVRNYQSSLLAGLPDQPVGDLLEDCVSLAVICLALSLYILHHHCRKGKGMMVWGRTSEMIYGFTTAIACVASPHHARTRSRAYTPCHPQATSQRIPLSSSKKWPYHDPHGGIAQDT